MRFKFIPKIARPEIVAMSGEDQVFFWEHAEAREKLLALQAESVQTDGSDSESGVGEVVVKNLDLITRKVVQSNWAKEELFVRRLRARDWRHKYDRMDVSGAGDHRC